MLRKILFYIFLVIMMLSTFFCMIDTTDAAPRPWGIAINKEAKKCAGYWGGDEFSFYPLPSGWKDYYPKDFLTIKTPYGDCGIKADTHYSDCCKQLNLPVKDYRTVPYVQDNVYVLGSQYRCIPHIFENILSYQGISINKVTRECTAQLKFRLGKEGGAIYGSRDAEPQQCLSDKNWIDFIPEKETEMRIITPYGVCHSFIFGQEKDCCEKLGFTFVSENIGIGYPQKPRR